MTSLWRGGGEPSFRKGKFRHLNCLLSRSLSVLLDTAWRAKVLVQLQNKFPNLFLQSKKYLPISSTALRLHNHGSAQDWGTSRDLKRFDCGSPCKQAQRKSKSTIFAQRKLLSTWLGCWICLWMELRWQSLIVWFMSVVDPTWLFLSKNLVVFGRLLGCLRVAEQLSSPCCSYFTLRCSQTECDKRWTKKTASQYIKRLLKKRDD